MYTYNNKTDTRTHCVNWTAEDVLGAFESPPAPRHSNGRRPVRRVRWRGTQCRGWAADPVLREGLQRGPRAPLLRR